MVRRLNLLTPDSKIKFILYISICQNSEPIHNVHFNMRSPDVVFLIYIKELLKLLSLNDLTVTPILNGIS